MARVLVTDGEQRSALAAVRSLGRAGHSVYVCAEKHYALTGASRFVREFQKVPSPLVQAGEYARNIHELVQHWNIELILPVTEASLLALLPGRERCGALLPFPCLTTFRRICDKAAVGEAARSVGLDVPTLLRLDCPEDCSRIRERPVSFPVVLKPARSVIAVNGSRTKRSVEHIADMGSLMSALERLPREAYPVLIQKRIEGPGVGVFVLIHDGELLASFCHRRIREKPPAGGVSVYRESIALDPRLLERSLALLRQFEWEGVAMVEYKVDKQDGKPWLMEINGRFWGSLQLAIDAGVDFPALLVAATTGRNPQPVHSFRQGVRSRWFWGDVDHLLLRLRRSADDLSLPPSAPGKCRALFDFLTAFGPGSRDEIFRFSDPAPAIRETINWLKGS
jgi:predicted ATP-grasp superfamily ATP-dependent carboligase